MPRINLTEARVRALNFRNAVRDTRDGKLRGFGVRVSPSGRKQFFMQCQHRGERVWKIVGNAETLSVAEARASAAEMLAAIRRGEEAPHAPGETLFEAVAETVFQRYGRIWKAATRRQPLLSAQPAATALQRAADRRYRPAGGEELVRPPARDAGGRGQVHAGPPVIMKEAERMGMRPEGSNPCRGIRRYRRKGRAPFLSDDEIRRLSARLMAYEDRWPRRVAVIRLLLLTGCRKGEILILRQSDYRNDHLFLRDSKTGPRTVPLNSRARRVLDRQPRTGSPFVFPSPRDPARPRSRELALWGRIRREAGIDDVRLHDLRHTHASHAVMNGVPVPVVSRLLGHSNVRMTLRYAHLGDRETEAAAERVGRAMSAVMKA